MVKERLILFIGILKYSEPLIARQHYSNEFSKWKGFDQANECQKIVGLEGRNGRIPFQTEYEVPDEIPTHNGWACCGDNFHNS